MHVRIHTDAATAEERARAAELLRLIAEFFDQPPDGLQQRGGELPHDLMLTEIDSAQRPHAAPETLS